MLAKAACHTTPVSEFTLLSGAAATIKILTKVETNIKAFILKGTRSSAVTPLSRHTPALTSFTWYPNIYSLFRFQCGCSQLEYVITPREAEASL